MLRPMRETTIICDFGLDGAVRAARLREFGRRSQKIESTVHVLATGYGRGMEHTGRADLIDVRERHKSFTQQFDHFSRSLKP